MKTKLLRNITALMLLVLCAAIFVVAAPKQAATASVDNFPQAEVIFNCDFNDNQIIGRHSEMNDPITISQPNFNKTTFNPRANEPVSKLTSISANDQQFYRRE